MLGKKNGVPTDQWQSPEAAANYARMEERRAQEDAIAAATGQEPMSDVAIMEEVLGHRSGYHRGMGYGAPIPEERRAYLEQPRDETFVNSDGEVDVLRRKVEHMEHFLEMFMSRFPMQSNEPHGSYSQPTPHMGGPTGRPDPGYSSQGFAPFTPGAPPTQPYYSQQGMSAQPVGHHPSGQQGAPGSSTHQQRHQHPSGFAPWSSGASAFQSASQHPQYGYCPFPTSSPSSGAGPSQQFYPPSYGHQQTSPSPVNASASQTGCGTSSAQVRQRQSNRQR